MAKCNKCGEEIDETKRFHLDILNPDSEKNKAHWTGDCKKVRG